MPRPEGKRCLVISSQHTTVSRHRNGSTLHKFSSRLPNGSRASTAGSGDNFCILDCVFHESDSVYYVLDIMCWKGYALYDCSAEFRIFWVQSKLAECLQGLQQEQQRYPFVPVPAFLCTKGEDAIPCSNLSLITIKALHALCSLCVVQLTVIRVMVVITCKCLQMACNRPTPHQCRSSGMACTCCTRRATIH